MLSGAAARVSKLVRQSPTTGRRGGPQQGGKGWDKPSFTGSCKGLINRETSSLPSGPLTRPHRLPQQPALCGFWPPTPPRRPCFGAWVCRHGSLGTASTLGDLSRTRAFTAEHREFKGQNRLSRMQNTIIYLRKKCTTHFLVLCKQVKGNGAFSKCGWRC